MLAAANRRTNQALAELSVRPRQGDAVDGEVDLLVVKRHQAGDRGNGGQWIVIRPGQVAVHGVADAHRLIARRRPLVRTQRLRRGGLQMLESDVGRIDVIPCGYPGFE